MYPEVVIIVPHNTKLNTLILDQAIINVAILNQKFAIIVSMIMSGIDWLSTISYGSDSDRHNALDTEDHLCYAISLQTFGSLSCGILVDLSILCKMTLSYLWHQVYVKCENLL